MIFHDFSNVFWGGGDGGDPLQSCDLKCPEALADMLSQYVKHIEKPKKNCGFAYQDRFRIASSHVQKNPENGGSGGQKL